MTIYAKALVRVTSNNSGGRAQIIITTHNELNDPTKWSKPDFLTNRIFMHPEVGSLHSVIVKVTETSRKVLKIRKSWNSNRFFSEARDWFKTE